MRTPWSFWQAKEGLMEAYEARGNVGFTRRWRKKCFQGGVLSVPMLQKVNEVKQVRIIKGAVDKPFQAL
jgi:hypothetical protein